MFTDDEQQVLTPVNFYEIEHVVPEITRFGYNLRTVTFDPPLDSADMGPEQWIRLVEIIEKNYDFFDGFVVLHGTDTMAYTASALSFMCENIHKPVIFTGSQLPLGKLRTDGREHLLTSIEIAALKHDGKALVPEVCIYFNSKLFRGNRSKKVSSELFNAFRSGNYPALAEVGVPINFNANIIICPDEKEPATFHKALNTDIGLLKIYPGISRPLVEEILSNSKLKAVVVESYGSGTTPSDTWFLSLIRDAVNRGMLIMNVSQCIIGGVNMKQYKTSLCLQETGVICGRDITSEAAITKLMFLFGQGYSKDVIVEKLNRSLRGEVNIS